LRRYERGPVVEPKEFWADMPIKRSITFRHLALEHVGAGACVNECVVARTHDRSLPLRIRMFLKENVNRKGFSGASGAENKEPGASWEYPKGVLDIQAALVNMADIFAAIWPLDPTPRVLTRVLVTYEYGAAHGGSEKDRSRLLEEFCDTVLRENARRAVTIGTPLTYQQARERWRDLAEIKKFGQQRPAHGFNANQQKGPGGGAGGGAGTGSGGKPGQPGRGGLGVAGARPAAGPGAGRGATVKFNGELVCYHYNNVGRGCTRPAKGSGCDNGRGGVYAHVCNFEYGNGVNCLGKHPRHANH
jgi:hypothetical protein